MDLLTDKFIGYEQREAHEFLSDLTDFLHEELINAKNAKGGEIEMVLPTDNYFRLDVDV
jgi:ubiquitin C-terminal hydrolase